MTGHPENWVILSLNGIGSSSIMTPGARLQAVIDLLSEIWDGMSPPDIVIYAYYRKRRYAGSGDRRSINDQVYNVLRRQARLDWWIDWAQLGLVYGPRSRLLTNLVVSERRVLGTIAELFNGERYCPAPLAGPEKELIEALGGRSLNHHDMPRPVAFEYPGWMDQFFSDLWGKRLETEILALNQPAPVDMRINTLKSTPEEAHRALGEACIEYEATPLSPLGVRIKGHPRVSGIDAFKQGLLEIQDEGSQLLAMLVGARPGMTVVDFCAGAGGKTLALAADMGAQGKILGRLFACDISDHRLQRMQGRLKRSGAFGVQLRTLSASEDNWVKENAGRADRVLVDAPCTGTGTWRRDVRVKWRFQPTDLINLQDQQREILKQAAILVKPGGRLIYATCSLLQEENEYQSRWFLQNFTNFSPMPMEQVWSETVGGAPVRTGLGLRLSPASTGTDGFYCVVLERFK